jgi:hypothetical protein
VKRGTRKRPSFWRTEWRRRIGKRKRADRAGIKRRSRMKLRDRIGMEKSEPQDKIITDGSTE